jgi:Gamma-glutamyl cyclotransferase, AIG2-like
MCNESVRRVDVFFYGLFMDKALLREKGCAPTNERIASVHGFALRIGQRATLVPSADHSVYGVVMSLSHDDIDTLYSEASVSMYRPEAVLAQLSSGMLVPALCFNLPLPPGPDERNAEYATKLRALTHQLGFPKDYVASIR